MRLAFRISFPPTDIGGRCCTQRRMADVLDWTGEIDEMLLWDISHSGTRLSAGQDLLPLMARAIPSLGHLLSREQHSLKQSKKAAPCVFLLLELCSQLSQRVVHRYAKCICPLCGAGRPYSSVLEPCRGMLSRKESERKI